MKVVIDISEEEYNSILSYVQVYNSHYADMIRKGKPYEERPKGEWITKEHSIEYYCSHCGERLDQCCENFCCHCGAEMVGGDENDI